MRTTILILSLTLLGLTSCNMEYDYSVRVHNGTSEPLTISYKTVNDRSGQVEKSITLAPDQWEVIIQTINLPNENGWRSNKSLVAEYVYAYKGDNIQSHLDWNSEKIKLERSDIGQAEYFIDYTDADF